MKNRVLKNASWIIGGKIVQALLGLVVTMLSARFLGPSGYGIINYAAALVAFAAPIMQLGLNATLVQEILENPEHEGEILGTAIMLSFVSAVACIVGVVSFSALVNPGEKETTIVCGLYSLLLIFQSLEMIQYWFQAKLLSQYTAITMLVAYLGMSAYKITLLISESTIYWFAVSQALDFAIISVVLLIVYTQKGGQRLCFNLLAAKKLFSKSKYFILSALMVTINSQVDRIMLKAMVDETAVGFYSAAVSCTGMTGFVFTAVIDSARPVIFEGKRDDQTVFEKRQRALYSIVIYLSVLQSVFVACFAKQIVWILYGEKYAPTVSILQIIIWYTTFSYIGAVRDIWILAEKKQKYIWMINGTGALLNVAMNAALIPCYGASGAAVASLITQVFTNVILGFIIAPIRSNNRIMLQSLNPRPLLEWAKQARSENEVTP